MYLSNFNTKYLLVMEICGWTAKKKQQQKTQHFKMEIMAYQNNHALAEKSENFRMNLRFGFLLNFRRWALSNSQWLSLYSPNTHWLYVLNCWLFLAGETHISHTNQYFWYRDAKYICALFSFFFNKYKIFYCLEVFGKKRKNAFFMFMHILLEDM